MAAAWSFVVVFSSLLLPVLVHCAGCCEQCRQYCDYSGDLYATPRYANLFSPCFPDPYPTDADCEWTITVSDGRGGVVEVYLDQLVLGMSSAAAAYCHNTTITLLNGDGGDSGGLQRIDLCRGEDRPGRHYCSEGPVMAVRFEASSVGAYQGFVLYYREVSADLAPHCIWLSQDPLTNHTASPHHHRPKKTPTPRHYTPTNTNTSPPPTDTNIFNSLTIGILCIAALIVLICFLGVLIKLSPRFRTRGGLETRSSFTRRRASSPFAADAEGRGGLSHRRSSWWRDMLSFRNDSVCRGSSTTSLFHPSGGGGGGGGCGGRSGRSELMTVSSGVDFPLGAPPSYEDTLPPPYTEIATGGSSTSSTSCTREMRVLGEGGGGLSESPPPPYSQAVLSCGSSDV
ncbi:uncharacterized protein LOC143295990 isoform X2 [Babylonia areolata]|uniref:uncharacterized protein LOC143295990 isoform X2 n=1 Tax=Babylonia areolata TaxID=304850 RepID=UPI003FD34D37